ncbi:unnamed protein product, partial [marine sediment metagenome]
MLEAAQKRLKAASKEKDPWELGYAHLEVCYALLHRSTEPLDFRKDSKKALSQADQAIETFTGIPFPGGIASAHLARASIYTLMADGEEDQLKKAAGVDRAFTSCLAAQDALNAEGVNTGQIFDIYSSVNVLLLQIREMIDDKEFQEGLDELIAATSTLLGETVAEDIKMRDEGESMLVTAQLLGALAEIEDDEEERRELLSAQSLVALQAASWLETTSDPDLIDQVWEEFQKVSAKLEGSAESIPET